MPTSFLSRRLVAATAALLAATLIGLPASTALAQEGSSSTKKKEVQPLIPPNPPVGKSDMAYLPWGVAIILAGLIIGVNFIPSKRGHQD